MKTDKERYGDARSAIAARDLDLTIKHISWLPDHLKRAAMESLRLAWPDSIAALVEDVVESGWMCVAEKKIKWKIGAGVIADAKTALTREEWSVSYRSIRIDHGDPLELESSKEERRMLLVEAIACLGMLRVWAFHHDEDFKGDVDDWFMAEEEDALLSFWDADEDRVQGEAETDRLRSISYYIWTHCSWGIWAFFTDALGWISEETGILEDHLANLVGIYLIRHRAQDYLTPRGRKRKKVRIGVRQEYVLEEMYWLNGKTRSAHRMSFMSKSELTRTLDSMIKQGLIEKNMGDYRITEMGRRKARAIIREKWP